MAAPKLNDKSDITIMISYTLLAGFGILLLVYVNTAFLAQFKRDWTARPGASDRAAPLFPS